MQKKLAERQKLLGQLDQAKMQEQMNTAMAPLSETVGQDVPTFDEVRDKIEARYAKAKGMAELTEGTVENRMLEVEQRHPLAPRPTPGSTPSASSSALHAGRARARRSRRSEPPADG